MKRIEDCDYSGYEGLVESFDVEVLLDSHDHDYQGDSYYLLRDGDRVGMLVFGWGSCSGCDDYQAAAGYGEPNADEWKAIYALRDRLWDNIKWFGSIEDAFHGIIDTDSKLQWYGHSDGFLRFVELVTVAAMEHYNGERVEIDGVLYKTTT